jgi:hypothetical protein
MPRNKMIAVTGLSGSGKSSFAFDTNFNPYTEYFYRIIAYNSQGSSASPWAVIRTSDEKPFDVNIDIDFLRINVDSGYKIKISKLNSKQNFEIPMLHIQFVFTDPVSMSNMSAPKLWPPDK